MAAIAAPGIVSTRHIPCTPRQVEVAARDAFGPKLLKRALSAFFSRPTPDPLHMEDHRALRPLAKHSIQAVQAAAAEVATASALKEAEFKWKGPGFEVLLTGDFLNWDAKIPLTKGADGVFIAKQKLPPGRYSYKFIVDGVWQHSQYQPTVSDGAGGFNNSLVIEEAPQSVGESEAPAAAAAAAAASTPPAEAPKPAAAATAAKAAAAAGGKPVGKAAGGKAGGKKAAGKPMKEAMVEDIIPKLKDTLGKEKGLTDLELVFGDNTLCGSFLKDSVPYTFWAFFPDGSLEGSRGFSLTSYALPPSTVEPFIIDERKITPELVVFWVTKRLFAQKLLSLN